MWTLRHRILQEGGDGDGGAGGAGAATGGDPGAGNGGAGGSLLDGAGGAGYGGAADPGASGGDGGSEGGAVWYYDSDRPGDGDPPDWFMADKYKTLAEQAKAYPELAKKLGGFTGAPEGDYELTMPEGIEGEILDDSPMLQQFKEIAKEANMSQETFTKVLHSYLTSEAQQAQATAEAELAKLGDNAQQRLKTIADWGMANLSEQQFEKLRAVATSAEAVEVIETLIGARGEGRLPDGNTGQNAGGMTAESLRAMKFAKDEHGNLKTSVDPEYARQVREAYAKFYGTGRKEQIVGGRGQ